MKARKIVICLILGIICLDALVSCAEKDVETVVTDISESIEESIEELTPFEETEAVRVEENTTEQADNYASFSDKLTCINNNNLYRMDIDFGINESLITYAQVDEFKGNILFSFYVEDEDKDFLELYLVNEKTGEIVNKREFDNSEIMPYFFVGGGIH